MVLFLEEWANGMKISLSGLSTLKLHVRWFTKVDEHPRTPHSNRFDMVVVTSIFLGAALPPRSGSPWKMHNLVLSVLKPTASCPTEAFFHLPEATHDKKLKCRPWYRFVSRRKSPKLFPEYRHMSIMDQGTDIFSS